jgi:hypothetical protein
MPNTDTDEPICDLIETRSARHEKTQRELCKLVLVAILDGTLPCAVPDDISLDKVFDHGGHKLTWRRVIREGLRTLERQNADVHSCPWMGSLTAKPAEFDRWLHTIVHMAQRPRRRAGAKPTLRKKLQKFVYENYTNEELGGDTYKQIAAKAAPSLCGKVVHERTVARALGRK